MEKKRNLHIGWLVTAMVVVLLIIDQWIKLYIKTQVLADSILIAENNGSETEFDEFKLNILVEKN